MSSFIISLDLELYWGVCGSRSLKSYQSNLKGVGLAVDGILGLFSEYDIRATWATVGFLFLNNENERRERIPEHLPCYDSPNDSTYSIAAKLIEENQDCFYLPNIIDKLKASNQEIGSHSYSHFYSLNNLNSDQAFYDDALFFNQVSQPFCQVKSYVFPRNQVSESHLCVLSQFGLRTFRGNDANRIYEKKGYLSKALRFLDSYLPVYGSHGITPYKHSSGLVNVPASTFLRPYNTRISTLNHLQLVRIKNAMTKCALNGQSFHLWWHPHNFGINLEQNISMLKVILEHYELLSKKYGMTNKVMGDFEFLAN
uniref:hypothetical protein n=1 Tax=Roseivirga sp. TaxID=1964215 RepID=UPI004048215D